MKLINFLTVFSSILFMATNSWCQQDTCVVLTGSPLNPDSYKTVRKVLEQTLNCYVKEVSLEKDEIATADLSNVKFLYWAGGPYYNFHPSKEAADNIRHAVANGMGYCKRCNSRHTSFNKYDVWQREGFPVGRPSRKILYPGYLEIRTLGSGMVFRKV